MSAADASGSLPKSPALELEQLSVTYGGIRAVKGISLRVEPGQIVATVGTLLVCWAIGSTIGPVPGTAMMAWLGPGGLFVYSAIVALGLAIFIVIRILQLRRPVSGGGFVALAPTSPANAALSPRLDEDSPGERAIDRHR